MVMEQFGEGFDMNIIRVMPKNVLWKTKRRF